jgi:glycyl-tRNA synthetase alpha chain
VNLQDIISALSEFWRDRGCALAQPYDIEKGAGTMNPATFFGSLGPEPRAVAYPEPSRRPVDGRYGENPLRLYRHWQYQVVIKPSPDDIQETYLESLEHLGVDVRAHDVRFVEDNWEAPTLGAWGLGWEVWIDGMEVTQFTYFQQMGGCDLTLIPVEMTYGLERLGCFLQGVTDIFELHWDERLTYGQVYRRDEYEHSRYSFEVADVPTLLRCFADCEREAGRALAEGLVSPAYDLALKCSHLFNLLEARGALSVTERTGYIARIRALTRACARLYVGEREVDDR